jgi:hypothetical protein
LKSILYLWSSLQVRGKRFTVCTEITIILGTVRFMIRGGRLHVRYDAHFKKKSSVELPFSSFGDHLIIEFVFPWNRYNTALYYSHAKMIHISLSYPFLIPEGGPSWSWSWWSVLLVKKTGVTGKNHQPVTSYWQTLSYNDVSNTPRLSGIQTPNISGDRYLLHR